jgi:predicted membrane metal-binding protein
VATVGLAPLTLVCFQQLSLVGFAANLVAIPLVTLLITPLALLGVLAAPLWTLAAVLVRVLGQGLAVLAAWPGAVWTVGVAPAWGIGSGLAAALLGGFAGGMIAREVNSNEVSLGSSLKEISNSSDGLVILTVRPLA